MSQNSSRCTRFNRESIDRRDVKRLTNGDTQGSAHQSKARGSKISIAEPAGTKLGLRIKFLSDEGEEVDDNSMVVSLKKVLWDGPWHLEAVSRRQ